MTRLWNSALSLLLITGGLLGLTLPFGKMAVSAGISPALWAFVISFGAGAVLLAFLWSRGKNLRLDGGTLRYFVITAAISYAIPNLLVFAAIPHLGAGFTGIMFTLSPLMTLAISLLLKLRKPNPLGIAGIAVGFVGAVMVTLTRGEASQPAEPFWIGVGLLVPVSLALGNIYRTLRWPENSGPIELAAGSHLAAAVMVLVVAASLPGGIALSPLAAEPVLVAVQVAASSAMFAFFFRLQAVGGPIYLSQIGYVAAAIGLISGTVFLGESYRLATWAGAAIISIGLAMTTRAQIGSD
ncbi:DMT family transporter [Pseudaminobacter sp. NGMCC 1.201702]|uniref:DMT family transporter n=1 Tax=Pseudaminobacter sp. NGMCC 1.201702 TaxID=3391825 RepID=UPI0039EF8098